MNCKQRQKRTARETANDQVLLKCTVTIWPIFVSRDSKNVQFLSSSLPVVSFLFSAVAVALPSLVENEAISWRRWMKTAQAIKKQDEEISVINWTFDSKASLGNWKIMSDVNACDRKTWRLNPTQSQSLSFTSIFLFLRVIRLWSRERTFFCCLFDERWTQ